MNLFADNGENAWGSYVYRQNGVSIRQQARRERCFCEPVQRKCQAQRQLLTNQMRRGWTEQFATALSSRVRCDNDATAEPGRERCLQR